VGQTGSPGRIYLVLTFTRKNSAKLWRYCTIWLRCSQFCYLSPNWAECRLKWW